MGKIQEEKVSSPLGRGFYFGGLVAAIVLLSLWTLVRGPVNVSCADIANALTTPFGSDSVSRIVWELRVPRIVAALLAGASLSVAGLSLQTVFQNPLCGPFVLGISSGASFGVALAMLAGISFGRFGVLGAASLGALAVTGIVLWIASKFSGRTLLLVAGLLVGYFIDALVSLIVVEADGESLRNYVSWGMGSFGRLTQDCILIYGAFVLVGLSLVLFSMRFLNAARLGDDFALGLGVSVKRGKVCVLLGASILSGATTAFCGPIAFVGIAVPHLAFMLFKTTNHRVLIPASALCGMLISLAAGLLPALPLNAVLSLVGVPVIMWVLLTGVQKDF